MYAGTLEITKCASYTSLDPVIVAYSTTETHPNMTVGDQLWQNNGPYASTETLLSPNCGWR